MQGAHQTGCSLSIIIITIMVVGLSLKTHKPFPPASHKSIINKNGGVNDYKRNAYALSPLPLTHSPGDPLCCILKWA